MECRDSSKLTKDCFKTVLLCPSRKTREGTVYRKSTIWTFFSMPRMSYRRRNRSSNLDLHNEEVEKEETVEVMTENVLQICALRWILMFCSSYITFGICRYFEFVTLSSCLYRSLKDLYKLTERPINWGKGNGRGHDNQKCNRSGYNKTVKQKYMLPIYIFE